MNALRALRACAAIGALGLATIYPAAAEDGMRVLMKDGDEPGSNLQWTEPKAIPPGTRMIMVYGNPGEPGPYIFRVRFPAGYKLPPHRHADRRQVTVLEGYYWSAAGETFEQDKLRRFGPRDYYVTEGNVPHFAWAETDVLIQESGFGPISNPIQYVRPEDDPRN